MVSEPFVVAGGIVRNRAWCLIEHLRAVDKCLGRETSWFEKFYLTGCNNDDTAAVLAEFDTVTFLNKPEYRRHAERPYYSSEHMGALRNEWANIALFLWPKLTHLWVVDSDVIPSDDCLARLLEVDKPVVGAWVPGCTPAEGLDEAAGQARRTGLEHRHNGPFPATMLGGCYLIRRDALDAGALWGFHEQGEDGAFGDSCRALGIEMWAQPLARCEHRMKKPLEPHGRPDSGVPI